MYERGVKRHITRIETREISIKRKQAGRKERKQEYLSWQLAGNRGVAYIAMCTQEHKAMGQEAQVSALESRGQSTRFAWIR